MDFAEVLEKVLELLQRQGRVSYRALRLRFQLDDEVLEGIKDELIDAQRIARDEDGKVLVWVDAAPVSGSQSPAPSPQTLDSSRLRTPSSELISAERRQLTVMFCDVVGSTALSERLDPEELREVVRAYQETCTGMIRRYDGHIAQHLGDGLLVYFGYPVAHDDDAQRAVRAGLEIIQALQSAEGASPRLPSEQHDVLGGAAERRVRVGRPFKAGLRVRIGVHTGLVVIGEIGSSEKREILALGETPNLAARLQALAEPDTVVISAATQRLVQGLFACQDLGPQMPKGISTPLQVYRVMRESEAQSRFEAAVQTGLTPLVGRAEELAVLQRRWDHAKAGDGQVVLLSGEPGIGKSRLVQEFKDQLGHERATRIEFRCSPYHQNSAFYPIIDHLQRLLQFAREDSPAVKLEKLQHTLSHYRFPQADTVPLLAALLSLPHPEGYPPITLSLQKQKEKTQAALVAWLVEEAEQNTAYTTWEDVHWADPSTLEVLTLFLDQVPTTRLLALLTFRPEFTSPWGNRAHLSQLTLSRLGHSQVEAMVARVTGGKALPPEVVEQIVAKTDGVPLFVEELTKAVVESVGAHSCAPLQTLAIPATLHDSLMARLDRLGAAKEIAQLGATLGREFSYELLQAVSPLDEATLQQGLKQLVEAELVYQRGLVPQAHYLFKHALIQDTAYQSLLKSTRQQYHKQVAQLLERQFPETKEMQPELVAHHYTEAGLREQAIPYWQQAGERASQRSAYVEAISHLTRGLELLKALPDTPERAQQELTLQLALGAALLPGKGYTAPEVEKTATRARELCQQLGETPRLFPVLGRLGLFYIMRGELQTAHELAKQMMRLAQSSQDLFLLSIAHAALGGILFFLGELLSARTHFELGIVLSDPQKHPHSTVGTADPRGDCLTAASWTLWLLGYPDQALKRSHEAVALAAGPSRPFRLTYALAGAAWFHLFCREGQLIRERAEATIALSSEQGFPHYVAEGIFLRGCALVAQGQAEEGVVQIRQGLAAVRAIGSEVTRPHWLALLAEACGKVGRTEEGLTLLAEALAVGHKSGQSMWEAELYRLKGTLTLQKFQVSGFKFQVEEGLESSVQRLESEAEEYFLKAVEIACKQQAKSLELRATMSLARLWQQQGKRAEARQLLAEIYGWFTEGFDTKDLQEAKALIEQLS